MVATRAIINHADYAVVFNDPTARAALRPRLSAHEPPAQGAAAIPAPGKESPPPQALGPPGSKAQAEQQEHDRYFEVARSVGDAADRFMAGLLLAHLAAYENCLDMGVTLLAAEEWDLLFGGLRALVHLPGHLAGGGEHAGATECAPVLPSSAGWRAGYDPGRRWRIGHQLFFSLIQGAIIGLNCFAAAAANGHMAEAEEGLRVASAFMRSSAAAMKFASDFEPADYERTVRPAMGPPAVRGGFSGLQTRDHAYLVRLLGALKPVFFGLGQKLQAHREFTESVISAYAAHEFICERFRGDVLPSLRMAAASRGTTQRPGIAVIRELMRARLALVDPAVPGHGRQP